MTSLVEIFPGPAELLQLEPEQLAGVLMEVIPDLSQNGMFQWRNFMGQVFDQIGRPWDHSQYSLVGLAIVEALDWLRVQGLIMSDPEQSGQLLRLTRRGQAIKDRFDLESYRKAGILPIGLLQPQLVKKVHHLFVRGDYDTAVLQAFKEVEVAVRKACGYPNDLVGRPLMQRAFGEKDAPLRNPELVQAEQDSEFFLFSGAIGHAKNPASHRDVSLSREEAARLIVFASHLLAIVESRTDNP